MLYELRTGGYVIDIHLSDAIGKSSLVDGICTSGLLSLCSSIKDGK